MRLRSRLLLSFAYLLILAVIALAIPLGINVQRRARADLESQLSAHALVIAASVTDVLATSRPERQLQELARGYAGDIEARVIVVDEDGRLVADSDARAVPAAEDFSNRPEIVRALEGDQVLSTRFSHDLGSGLLVVAAPVLRGAVVLGAVRLSQTTAEIDRRVRFSWLAIALAGALVVAAGVAIAFALARSLLGPLRSVQATASALAAGDLSARAPEGGPPDIAEVARALNQMSVDLERTIEAQNEFVANASHQLRTPLTGLRLRLESLQAGSGGPDDAAAAIQEVDRLGKLVADLLRLERARAVGASGSQVDLAALVRSAAARWDERARSEGRTIRVDAEPAQATADPEQLAMAVDNLVENAIVYSIPGAEIGLRSGTEEGVAFVGVQDPGPGIPSADLPHVRQRFFRGARAQAVPGTGLGLAIVEEVVTRWGGRLELHSDESGTRAELRFTVS